MGNRSLLAVFALVWCAALVTGARVFGAVAAASFVAAVVLAWALARLVGSLKAEWLEHPLARDAMLSFLGVFVGSLAASIGIPLLGAMLASSCGAIALVRAAAWLAVFAAGDE